MAMRRRGAVQDELWIASSALARPGGHRFYEKLNELLAEAHFDKFVEDLCLPFFVGGEERGRPSIAPGMYFACFSWVISKELNQSAVWNGVARTRFPCAPFWGCC